LLEASLNYTQGIKRSAEWIWIPKKPLKLKPPQPQTHVEQCVERIQIVAWKFALSQKNKTAARIKGGGLRILTTGGLENLL
jgi:hypothetical protein